VHPDPDRGDLDEAEITRRGFVVSGRQLSRVLQLVEVALDAVAQGLERFRIDLNR
jgi:hypothetical protein